MDIQNIENVNEDEIDVQHCFKNGRLLRKQTSEKKICAKDERNASIKKVSQILQKGENERTNDELQTLSQCSDAVEEVQLRWKKRDEAKRRIEEFEEPYEQLQAKCQILAQAIAQSQHLVVYTGAGISTAAQIPDYRGSNGIWTRLQQGKDIGDHDLSQAEPTYTHMALFELYRQNILKYVVSQNCDGLHLRSGLPKTVLSELHGNMYIEVCNNCKPVKEYWRSFDVTENTARFSHKTMRKCYECNSPLVDTIVHFGERGSLQWPLNWSGACKNAKKATTIVCLGSSLKVLKKYPWLWQMDKPVKKRPNLYIINLQWTPKDDCANVKIHGKCDSVMKIVMNMLGINVPSYNRENDPVFYHSTSLCDEEMHTTSQPLLKLDYADSLKSETKDEYITANLHDYKQNKCPKSSDLCRLSNNINKTEKSNVDNCDNQSNIIRKTSSETSMSSSNFFSLPTLNKTTNDNVLPLKSTGTAFSIDNILDIQSQPKTVSFNNSNVYNRQAMFKQNSMTNDVNLNNVNNNIIMNHSYAILRYYQISNILLHNQLLGYHDLMHYPFQTSFLYPGLHSIINPATYEDCPSYNNLGNQVIRKKETSDCEFCNKYYQSLSCLFYTKSKSKFLNHEFRVNKLDNLKKFISCVCCDYSSDEEGKDDIENNIQDECCLPVKIKKIDENCKIQCIMKPVREKEQIKKIQAGWFGKGYKKNRKLKKR